MERVTLLDINSNSPEVDREVSQTLEINKCTMMKKVKIIISSLECSIIKRKMLTVLQVALTSATLEKKMKRNLNMIELNKLLYFIIISLYPF